MYVYTSGACTVFIAHVDEKIVFFHCSTFHSILHASVSPKLNDCGGIEMMAKESLVGIVRREFSASGCVYTYVHERM